MSGAGGLVDCSADASALCGSEGCLRGGGAGFVRGEVTDKGSVEEGGGAGGGKLASTPSGGVSGVSGATLVSGLESDGLGIGVDATGTAAFTVFCSHPVLASANPLANSTNKAAAFLFRLGIYLFSSAKRWLKARSFPAEASMARASGSSTRTVVPRPTSESNSIRPLCNCTNRKALASPIPVPPALV